MWYLSQFNRLALRAHNNKFVCRHGGDGALKASFMHSRQAWLKKNQEVFEIEWHGGLMDGDAFGARARSVSHPHPHDHQRRHLLTASSSDATSRSQDTEVSPFLALRADNGRYWRVTYPDGLLIATGTDQKTSADPAVSSGGDAEAQSGGGDDTPPPRCGRTDEELFTIEVHHANTLTIRNKATGTYVEVREDGSLRCDPSAALQLCIKDAQLFQLAFKVAFKTAQGLFVSVLPNGGLVPSCKRIDRKEVFLIQLRSRNTCTISTTKKRCWRVGKKGVVAADGKPTNEPAKEELFTIDCPVNGHGVGWTIRSCSHLLYLRPEGNKRIIADSEYSPSTSTPQDPNCYFSLVFPEKGEAEEEEPSPVVEERRRHTIRESGGVKKLRRIIEAFEMRTEELPLEDQKDPEYRLLEGERMVLLKHHLLSFHRCEAAMGTAVLTNYRLAFCPDDPKAAEKGAHCFSFPLTIITKITKVGPITTEAGNYRGLQVVLKDFRTYYFCSIPFTSIRKPKMDTFFQVLEDHTFPTRLSDFFAFAHRSALAAEAECPKVNARTPHYSRAVRKAIAEPHLASWKAESPLIHFSDGFASADSGDSFPTRRFPRVGRARQPLSRSERERLINEQAARSGDASPTTDGQQNIDHESGSSASAAQGADGSTLGHVEELGQLKSELFGMASQSPVAAPLFAKEVEARWAATKPPSASPEPKDRDKLLSSPFLSSRTIAQNGWELYLPMDDYGRLELDVSPWRISPINWDYSLCETYPRLLVVPASVSDEDIKQVKQFRSKGRIPVPTWRHKESGSIIVRCSQPKTGLLSDRSEQDEKLVSSIRQACGTKCTVYLIDARPRVNAVMNTLTGAGVENAAVYNIHHDNRIFLGIPNIHVVRDSGSRLTKIIDVWNLTTTLNDMTGADGVTGSHDPIQTSGADSSERLAQKQTELRLLDKVLDTGWLDHITALLSGAVGISNLILESSSTGVPVAIIVHCSDGWDRTPQLVALAQLLLDPHYRTIHGYEILIEKEFLSFGHRFQDRCGHHGKKEKDQRSPIFHQFLECTWQLLQQFPSAFEFNELFLETVLEHVYSCRFGTFFMNSAKERADSQLAERTCSLWTTINGFGSDGEDVGVFSPEDVETPAGAAADAASLVRVSSTEKPAAPSTPKASQSQSSDDDEREEVVAKGEESVDWDAVMRRRRKYVNPRYIHGRHHHLMPVVNLCQRDPSLSAAATTSPPPPANAARKLSGTAAAELRRRNSAPDPQDGAMAAGTEHEGRAGPRRKSSASKPSPRSPRSPLGFASTVSGDIHAGGPLSDNGSDDDELLSDPDLDDEFEVVDHAASEEEQAATAAAAAAAARDKGAKGGGGLAGLGREDVEDMLEYLGNKWRRAGIGLYHAAIDRTRGPGPEVGSIRFWAALYLRWRRGDVLFPTPLPAGFLSPASMPASPALPDAPATMVVAAAAAAPTTAVTTTIAQSRSPPASPKRLRRSASSAPALSAGRYSAPVAASPHEVPDSLASTLSGGPTVHARKTNSGELSLHTRVQLGELKRAATKTKADAALFSLSRSSRAD